MFNLLDLLNIVKDYEGAFMTIGGAVLGWWGQIAKNRLQRQRNEIDANNLENEQLKLALERERFLTDKLNLWGASYTMLWERLYDRESVIKDYHSAALSAQRRVNELEIRLGASVTMFEELPEFPPEDPAQWAAQCPPSPQNRDDHHDNTDPHTPRTSSSPLGGRQAPSRQEDHRSAKED
ncbi:MULTISPECIES: hypothetical protein [unclassified Saccharibacter]|uniref:hypothetical protein n=1 Tax=unclassified Saccharibacter TaxID=2648722 RepID=UPI0013247185|nr:MULTISPECIES: hypothetical protein [unclassified Saccharibacter]MXV35854.1 hypothetical protein [Saccharibacter sp. EH611]MXV57974.1 hypothetical protein [Saccharibacter sp. EH70]MXV66369.1 hypothetical protein [Saccharibacter sp. EH60]